MFDLRKSNRWVMLAAALMVGVMFTLPAAAQTVTPTPPPDSTLVIVVGEVDISPNGSLMVNGYIIAPAGAILPPLLREGDLVLITGYLLPDGMTIQATSVEFFTEPTPTPVPTLTLTPIASPVPVGTVTPTPIPTLTPSPQPTAVFDPLVCNQPNHPVALALAAEFDVSYEVVIGMHCDGFGFGEITRAFLLAETTGLTAQDYLDLKASGFGWGQIVREAGVHPSELAPGRVISGNPRFDQSDQGANDAAQPNRGRPDCPGNSCNAPGQGGNNGNGNNGRGNGNGNGNNGRGGRP